MDNLFHSPPRRRRSGLISLALLAGCTSVTEFGDGASTGEPTPAGTTTTGSLPTSADPSGLETTSSMGTGSGESSGNASGCGLPSFICNPDGGTPTTIECSVTEQDCPRGEKCNAWANDGGNSWNATQCFPLDPNPDLVDETCTVEGSGVSGIDSCEVGAICLDVDSETNEGICIPYCVGSGSNVSCEDPTRVCLVSGNGIRPLCPPNCDPLDVDTCPEGQVCLESGSWFACVPHGSADAGQAFDTCEFGNACDPGLFCGDAPQIGACAPEAARCCTPYCDLTAPACPEPTTCVPYFDEGQTPPGFDDLGLCGNKAPRAWHFTKQSKLPKQTSR